MKPTLHALLIAISQYPNKEDCLGGPINDLVQMKRHLKSFCEANGFDDPVLHYLTDSKATRENIIEGYKNFLGAKEGDTCLVYYSGHGYRIKAHPAFRLDSHGMHEALYCYDARKIGRGILDKELAYLGWKYVEQQGKKLHFVEIFDCCHAGGITRATGESAVARSRAADKDAKLKLEDYLGIEEYTGYSAYEATKTGGIQAPVAKRIQLAAARSDETAKEDIIKSLEDKKAGYFTTSLCEVLEAANYCISYSELMDKAWFKVKKLALDKKRSNGDQSPIMDVEREEPYHAFGTGKPEGVQRSYVVGYDHERQRWIVRAGAALGIPVSGETLVKIGEDSALYKLEKVFSDVSELSLHNIYKKDNTYAAAIHSMNWDSKLKLAFEPRMEGVNKTAFSEKYKSYFIDKKPLFLDWTEDAEAADFHLICQNKAYYMVEKGKEVPLFKRCKLDELPAFFENADKAAKWFFVKKLYNPLSALKKSLLEIEVTKYEADNDYQPQPVRWDKPVDLSYGVLKQGQPRLSVAIKSNYGQQLWTSIVWLSSDFDINNGYVQSGKSTLQNDIPLMMARWSEKNKEWNEKVFVSMPKPLQNFGVTEAHEFIKVFVSTKDIDTSSYNQSALPFDETYYRNRKAVTRGGGGDEESEPDVEANDHWIAFTIPLRIVKSSASGEVDELNYRAEVLGHEIKVPAGFKAKIGAGGQAQGRRSTGLAGPVSLQADNKVLSYQLSQGLATSAPLDALELREVENKDLVTPENPILMSLPNSAANEMVISIGYDAETGLYYPVGYEDKQSKTLRIETLPDPTSDGQRSLGGSIVLFLKKVVLETVKQDPDKLYKLSLVTLPDNLEEDAQFDDDAANVGRAVAGAQRILLCTHGIIGDTAEMVKFVKRIHLHQPYDVLLAYDYENLDSQIEDIAAKLESKLAAVGLGEGHGKQFHVVAHSMGGLVSRWFVEQMSGGKVISHLVMVGTPNNGSQWSSVAQFVTVGLGFAMNFLEMAKPVQMLLSFLGKYGDRALSSLMQMHPDSDFMKKLNDKPLVTIPYSIIAGDIMSVKTDQEKSFFEKLFLRLKKVVAKPLFREPNDIAATVKSIQGVNFGNTSNAVACDHLSYFVDERGLGALEEVMAKI